MWVNLTTNTIEVISPDKPPLSFPPSGVVARINRSNIVEETPIEGVQIVTHKVSAIWLHEPADGKQFIVTEDVARACPERTDLFVALTSATYATVGIACLIRYSTAYARAQAFPGTLGDESL